jgi:GT2 family glycosyltransferase
VGSSVHRARISQGDAVAVLGETDNLTERTEDQNLANRQGVDRVSVDAGLSRGPDRQEDRHLADRKGQVDRIRLHGVLVTYRRHHLLRDLLHQLDCQERHLDSLIVVDNQPNPVNRAVVAEYARRAPADYVAARENLGPAGGIAFGMQRVLERANDSDWVVLIDDDMDPLVPGELARLVTIAESCREMDPTTAGIGERGGRFSWSRARGKFVRLVETDRRIVDYLGGNGIPTYRVAAIRDVGPFASDLFFGLDDYEYGLRLRARGYSLYKVGIAPGKLHTTKTREGKTREGLSFFVSGAPNWRRYYSLRNLILILRRNHHSLVAVRVTMTRGVLKPLVSLPLMPRYATRHLAMNLRSIRDAWTGRTGRQVEPSPSDYPPPPGRRTLDA